MTPKQALSFVKANGVVLESGRGRSSVPSLAETIAGEAIRGSWWKHPKANIIFGCSRTIRSSDDVLVCRLVANKVTYVHRRLWPALVRLGDRFPSARLGWIREIHTESGKHRVEMTPFPKWVPRETVLAAQKLSIAEAVAAFPDELKIEIRKRSGSQDAIAQHAGSARSPE